MHYLTWYILQVIRENRDEYWAWKAERSKSHGSLGNRNECGSRNVDCRISHSGI